MAKLGTKQIRELAMKMLGEAEGPVRRGDVVRDIEALYPDTPRSTISVNVSWEFRENPLVEKLARGTYTLVAAGHSEVMMKSHGDSAVVVVDEMGRKLLESDFYLSFTEWLRDEQEEVTQAIPVGGNILRGKWNTPDVIGVLRPMRGDPIQFAPQIVSAEIKIDPSQPVTAFGQAISYRLFSHKSYLVLPETTSAEDKDRIEDLCAVFGLGLVMFTLDAHSPNFRMITRAVLAEPDMTYVNQMAKRLNEVNNKVFDRLF